MIRRALPDDLIGGSEDGCLGEVLRLAAFLLDTVIVVAAMVVLITAFGMDPGNGNTWVFIAALCLYKAILTAFNNGQTIGKMIFRIKVVSFNGDSPHILVELIREPLGTLLGLFHIFTLMDDNGQGWHDKLAETYTVWNRNTNYGRSFWAITVTTLMLVIMAYLHSHY